MNQTLQLRHDVTLDAAPHAWFLPGDSVLRWLEELARSGLATMDTRLFIVPKSIADRTPAGLLVVPAQPDSISEQPVGLGCRQIAGRLFVPIDAALEPPVNDAELRGLCVLPISFYHPVFGLSGFEAESGLRMSDLVESPEEKPANWNFARSGPGALLELTSVMLLQPPSTEDIFGGAEDEIGTEPLGDLPPAPGEPGENPLAKTGRKLRWFFARGASEMMKHVPHTGLQRNWLNNAEDWANNALRGVNSELEQLRNKELHRLLHLLDTDPEAGLRQAIPMSGFANRGTAPLSARLGSRSLNFDPSRLGGRAADFWNIPSNLQEVLRRRYREMADREMQLGRHRRAAYIYAELLGDLVSAANAFKQGRLYREAALLYEEHLRNPLEAARCLAEGGLLAEAIERYEKLGRWLEIADLHERAGNQPAAEAALRRVIDERLARNDILSAAKLVEERLHQPDEALEMLLNAWPSSSQAVTCVGAAFDLLARLGRHETALERLARFAREPVMDHQALLLLSVLGNVARTYPHDGARHRAADFSRVLIARQLQRTASSGDEARLLEHLVRLAPQDRVLSRDANRYLADRRATALRANRVAPVEAPANRPVILRRFELPRQIQWLRLRQESRWFFALGVTEKHLTVLRGIWSGQYQSLTWDCPASAVKHGFVFEPASGQVDVVTLARLDGVALQQKVFPAADIFFNRQCHAGTPPWLALQGFPFAVGDETLWSVHLASDRAVVSCHTKAAGRLQRTIDITDDLLADAERTGETRLSLTPLGEGFAVALGNRLVLSRGDGGIKRVDLPGQAVSIFGTIPNTRCGVAVMLHQGAVMHWVGSDDCIELDRDIPLPIGAFVPGGPLVLASGSRLLVLEVDSKGVRSVNRMELAGQKIAGVSPADEPGQFAVLGERGEVTVYKMPR